MEKPLLDMTLVKIHSKRIFNNRAEAYEYLDKEVFLKEDFRNHVAETAKQNEVSYLLAYDLITIHLTDIFYEIDIAVSKKRGNIRISIQSFFYLKIGFLDRYKKVINRYKKSKNNEL